MIEAMVAGVRSPQKLAQLADRRIKASPKALYDALHGHHPDGRRWRHIGRERERTQPRPSQSLVRRLLPLPHVGYGRPDTIAALALRTAEALKATMK